MTNPQQKIRGNITVTDKPLIVTDGRYVFCHHLGQVLGPFVVALTDDGQVADEEQNRWQKYGLPFNPRACVGGRVHHVENPMFPPRELFIEEPQI